MSRVKFSFYKYSAAGNDFIIIDRRINDVTLSSEQIEKICHRRFGIGADGVIYIDPSEIADFKMTYFNSDGAEASMCGNGARSLAHYHSVCDNKNELKLQVGTEIFLGGMTEEGEAFITLKVESKLKQVNLQLSTDYKVIDSYYINTGVPHTIVAVDDLSKVNFDHDAGMIRYHEHFEPDGTNVDFIERKGENQIWARVYERGIEGETFSSGTGASACAIAASKIFEMKSPIVISMKGGDIKVSFSEDYKEVILKGELSCSFKGEIEV